MAVRKILKYPDKRLRERALTVSDFGTDLGRLIDDMAETMYAAPGVGLAAPQVGVPLRLFLVDVSNGDDEPSDLRVFVNPELADQSGEVVWAEGCLSFPGVTEDVKRAERGKVRAQDRRGACFELEADGLLAVAIQHEYDHLEGRLLVDRVSLLRRRLIERAMRKRATETALV